MAAIVDWVLEIARLQPFVVVLEDIQWSDPSTLELVHDCPSRQVVRINAALHGAAGIHGAVAVWP